MGFSFTDRTYVCMCVRPINIRLTHATFPLSLCLRREVYVHEVEHGKLRTPFTPFTRAI